MPFRGEFVVDSWCFGDARWFLETTIASAENFPLFSTLFSKDDNQLNLPKTRLCRRYGITSGLPVIRQEQCSKSVVLSGYRLIVSWLAVPE